MNEELKPLFSLQLAMWDAEMARKPKLIYDIGANEGGYARTMSYYGGDIHAFEPVPSMFRKMVDAIRDEGLTRVTPFNLGVSDEVGMIKNVNVFNTWTLLNDGEATNRALDFKEDDAFTMHLTTLDVHGAMYGYPDFIKLDVDGYEYKVLKGGSKMLREKPCPMLMEYSFLGTRYFQHTPLELCELIYAYGYRAWSINGDYCAETAQDMMKYYPYNTSYDIILKHRDDK